MFISYTLPAKIFCARLGPSKNGLNAPHDVFVSVFHVCLTILKHFAKKNIKIYKKITKLDFGQIFLKISKISKNLENIFENFPLKIVLKIENFEILKFLIFRFSIRFSMENFQKYFWDFRDFQKFWDFFDFGFCSKIKKFSTFFDDFF